MSFWIQLPLGDSPQSVLVLAALKLSFQGCRKCVFI